jgi:hypothetical protein
LRLTAIICEGLDSVMAFVVQGSRRSRLLLLALIALALCAFWGPGSSRASMILGSDLATEPTGNTMCSSVDSDRGCLAIDDAIPGGTAVSPSTGMLSAWHVRLGTGTAAQTIRFRVVRRNTDDTFTMIASGPLESVPAGAGTYTFPLNLTIHAGDQIAMDADSGQQIMWRAPLTGAASHEFNPSPLDGESTAPPVFTNPDFDHTFNAVLNATNSFTLGAVTRDKKKGTATVQVQVSNPGQLIGAGSGVSVASVGARESQAVSGPGPATLTVRATGKKKRTLKRIGKVKLNLSITFTPTGGDPNTLPLEVKLKKKL